MSEGIPFRGYLGEELFALFLMNKYPPPEYTIVRQIRPNGVDSSGGPYLDFAVVKTEMKVVQSLWEIKSYKFRTIKLNKSLYYMWSLDVTEEIFVTKNGTQYRGNGNIVPAYLVFRNPKWRLKERDFNHLEGVIGQRSIKKEKDKIIQKIALKGLTRLRANPDKYIRDFPTLLFENFQPSGYDLEQIFSRMTSLARIEVQDLLREITSP